MTAAVDHGEWLAGWNAGVCAAMAKLTGSDLPEPIADHAADLVQELIEEDESQ